MAASAAEDAEDLDLLDQAELAEEVSRVVHPENLPPALLKKILLETRRFDARAAAFQAEEDRMWDREEDEEMSDPPSPRGAKGKRESSSEDGDTLDFVLRDEAPPNRRRRRASAPVAATSDAGTAGTEF